MSIKKKQPNKYLSTLKTRVTKLKLYLETLKLRVTKNLLLSLLSQQEIPNQISTIISNSVSERILDNLNDANAKVYDTYSGIDTDIKVLHNWANNIKKWMEGDNIFIIGTIKNSEHRTELQPGVYRSRNSALESANSFLKDKEIHKVGIFQLIRTLDTFEEKTKDTKGK